MFSSIFRQQFVAIIVAGMALFSGAVFADDNNRLLVFGDSLSDPGNAFVLTLNISVPPFQLIPDAPYARGGMRFSNGPTWVEQLADSLDAERSAGPALRQPIVFSNYAVGGARARNAGPFHLSMQVDLFLRDFGGYAPSDALYVVYFGGNDVRDALESLATDPYGRQSAVILQEAVLALRDNLLKLYAAGARRFLVPNAPDIGLVPAVRLQGPLVQGAASQLAGYYNLGLGALLDGLSAGGLQITRLDVFALLNAAVAAPAAYGFSNVLQPCIAVGTTVNPYCSDPGQYLFWDGIHPTRAGHAVVARRAAEALGANVEHAHAESEH